MSVFGDLCTKCKGRLWCGLPKCPILEAAKDYLPRLGVNTDSIFGPSPPSIFVGRYGYPKVFAGPLVSESSDSHILADTANLYGRDLDFILRHTSSLLRVSLRIDVRKPGGRLVNATQEISMSVRPLDTEVEVEKIEMNPSIDAFFHPTGPKVIPRRIDVVDNPSIPRKVDDVVDERLKAEKAVVELYRYGFSVDYLQRLLSSGVLGINKKLVPTRWSITAVDDIIGRKLLQRIRGYETIDEIEYYFNDFMGNEFHIILIPGIWEYEMIESWLRGAIYTQGTTVIGADYEPYGGRRDYASNITGAYYAARLAVVEHFESRKRQAKVLIYREITPDYKLPLGVWVIRETVRRAFLQKPVKFTSIENATEYMLKRTNVKMWVNKSKLLYNIRHQRTLDMF